MEKKKLTVLLLLLSGCAEQRTYACSRIEGGNGIYLNIEALRDRVVSAEMTERYELPYDLLLDKERLGRLAEQLDEGCFFHGNALYCECRIVPEEEYSLDRTLEQLKQQRFICE